MKTFATSQTLRDLSREYERMIAADPTDATARFSLGLARMYEERWEEAAEQFRQVADMVPDYADAHARLALVLLRLGKYSEAQAAIDRALILAPEDTYYQSLRELVQTTMGGERSLCPSSSPCS